MTKDFAVVAVVVVVVVVVVRVVRVAVWRKMNYDYDSVLVDFVCVFVLFWRRRRFDCVVVDATRMTRDFAAVGMPKRYGCLFFDFWSCQRWRTIGAYSDSCLLQHHHCCFP